MPATNESKAASWNFIKSVKEIILFEESTIVNLTIVSSLTNEKVFSKEILFHSDSFFLRFFRKILI